MRSPILATALSFLCIALALSLGRTKPARNPAQDALAAPARHVIFLIHGIGGNKTHFGAMAPALQQALPDAAPQTLYEIVPFEYDTEDDEKDTYFFAKVFGDTMAEYFQTTAPPTPRDKISLIMHSQGGLVGAIWMFRAFAGDPEYHPEFAPHLDAFLTLGTPFWGAKTAFFSNGILSNLLSMGQKQLQEMSFGSETIFNFRKRITSPEFRPILDRIRNQVRPLNLGGIVTNLTMFAPFVTGSSVYEDDTAVPLPCAQLDFLYAISNKPDYAEGETLPADAFQDTALSRFLAVDALHISLFPENRQMASLVQIPKECITDPQCEHPTYAYIVQHLLGQKVEPREQDRKLQQKLTAFLIDLNIHLPLGHGLSPGNIRVRFKNTNRWNPFKRPKVRMNKLLEFYSNGHNSSDVNPEYLRYFFTGTIRNPSQEAPTLLEFTVSAKGYRSRLIQAKVRATATTFVEVNLDRLPPMPVDENKQKQTSQ